MKLNSILLAVGVLFATVSVFAEQPGVSFVKQPTATKTPTGTRIEFAVDRETDVAIYVEDANSRIVRHLVAGVLGKNPPAPLKAGSLAQSLDWDGKDDDGKPAGGGPFKARVAAGLRVRYAGTAFSDKTGPNSLVDVMGLATGPDGRLYVLSHRWQRYVAFTTAVHVFRRDGSYEQTIKPFHSNLADEAVRAAGAFRLPTKDEGLVPIIYSVNLAISYYPNSDVAHQPVVTRDSRLVLAVTPGTLAIIGRDGGIGNATYAGGPLKDRKAMTDPLPDSKGGFVSFNMPYLAVSADSKTVYLTGLGSMKFIPNAGSHAFNDHAVYATTLPDRGCPGPAAVLFGDPQTAGNDDKHLSDPRGIAWLPSGKGRLLVADFGNNRVVVLNGQDGSFAGSFPVEAPTWVGADPRTGAVYVGAKRSSAIKFTGWQNARELASVDFAGLLNKVHANNRPGTPMHFALDSSAEPPVLWAGCGASLVRVEDLGDKFSEPQPPGAYAPANPWNLSADPMRRDVACQMGSIRILNEETGKITGASTPNFSGETALVRLGPNGEVYAQPHGIRLQRFERSGKPLPFGATTDDTTLKGSLNNRPEGTTYWPRDFCVDRHGDLYVKNRGKAYHGLMTVDQYGPDGVLKRTAIWVTSDGALGPRVDPKGNLYMAEGIKPLGEPYPGIFKGRVTGPTEKEYLWMYGSVVKYGPKGGAAWFPAGKEGMPFDGECKLDPSLKKEKVSGTRGAEWIKELELQGAEWWRPGYAYLLDMAGRGTDRCHCTASDFDVDDFGRTFYPNQGLFRVEVLDTNGNRILNVGGYGNQDCCGPDSYVLDPAGKFLRPRTADDPKDLVSPFAQPELAFNWFVGLAITDRYLYVADGVNRRVLRGKLDYAALATVTVP